MPRMRRKTDLPAKLCATCALPFARRRKWARDWARDWARGIRCPDRCRAARGPGPARP